MTRVALGIFVTLAGLTAGLVANTAFALPLMQASACPGVCAAALMPTTGWDIHTCPGTEYYVKVKVTAESGKCVERTPPNPSDPCEDVACKFSVTMNWLLPSGTNATLCNNYLGTPHCIDQPANGAAQQLSYPMESDCNGFLHDLSATGSTTCGTIQAHDSAVCGECSEAQE